MTFETEEAEAETHRLTEVEDTGDYWMMSFDDGCCLGLAKEHGIEPKPGDTVTVIGSFGYPVRGVAVNGRVAFYRTQEQQNEHHRQWVAQQKAEQRAAYEKRATARGAEIAALPALFQERIAGFRARNPSFYENEEYELFVCKEAAIIADIIKAGDAARAFKAKDVERQKAAAPGLAYADHSGNTFRAAVHLAVVYLEHPEHLAKAHGALCPLVGCKDYGCWAASQPQEAPGGRPSHDD